MGINVYQWCMDICSWTLLTGPDIKLGGYGQVVQIDESVFTHQGKVHQGRIQREVMGVKRPPLPESYWESLNSGIVA